MTISAELDIVNSALVLIDEALLDDLEDNESKTAKFANLKWPSTRDGILRLHPWQCTRTRAILVKDGTDPLFGFNYRYALPSDPYCLRPLAIQYTEDGDYFAVHEAFGGSRALKYQYSIEGRYLLTNTEGTTENTEEQEGINLVYTQRPAAGDVSLYDATLIELFIYKLAAELAYPLTGSRNLGLTFRDEFKDLLKAARSINSMEIAPNIPVGAVLGAYN